MNDRMWRIGLIVTCLFALLLRLGYTWFADEGRFRTERVFNPDGKHYEEMARSLAEGKGFCLNGHPTSWRSPFYPAYVSVFMRVTARPLIAVRLSQCVLGALTCLLAGLLGACLCDRRVGLVTAAACAASYELIVLNAYILTETLFTALLLAGLLLVLGSFRHMMRGICVTSADGGPPPFRSGRGRPAPGLVAADGRFVGTGRFSTIAGGAVLGLMTLTRASGLLLPLVLGACLLLEARRSGALMRAGRRLLLLLVVFAATLLPWIVRNNHIHNKFILLTSEPGKLLYCGYGPSVTGGTGGWFCYGKDVTLPPEQQDMTESEKSHHLVRAAVEHALSDPLRAIGLIPRKFWNMWRPWVSGASRSSTLAASLFYLPVVLLAAASPFVARSRRRNLLPIYGVVLYMVALHAMILGAVRFRYPVMPLLVLLASACLCHACERWRAFRDADAGKMDCVGMTDCRPQRKDEGTAVRLGCGAHAEAFARRRVVHRDTDLGNCQARPTWFPVPEIPRLRSAALGMTGRVCCFPLGTSSTLKFTLFPLPPPITHDAEPPGRRARKKLA